MAHEKFSSNIKTSKAFVFKLFLLFALLLLLLISLYYYLAVLFRLFGFLDPKDFIIRLSYILALNVFLFNVNRDQNIACE